MPLRPRHRPLTSGALPHARTRRPRPSGGRLVALSAAVLLSLLAACGRGADAAEAADPQARIEELVEVLTPLDPTLTSDRLDARLRRQRALLEELRAAGPEVGRAALEYLEEHPIEVVPVRRGLLDVAAHAAPEEAEPLLVRLIEEYGHPMDLRAEAAKLLGRTSPERALEVLRPLLEKVRRRTRTLPDDEFLLDGYLAACERTGTDPTMILADVATNIFIQDAARHRAAKELGKHPGPFSRAALEAILVESTGNGYLRRMAAQALRDSLPAESACALFREVYSREADLNMRTFLEDMIRDNCP